MTESKDFSAEAGSAKVVGTVSSTDIAEPVAPPLGMRALGPRITFHFVGEWNAETSYVLYDVVRVNGTSYIGNKINIAKGINPETDNNVHWVKWNDPNAQVELLQQTVNGFDGRITEVETEAAAAAADATAAKAASANNATAIAAEATRAKAAETANAAAIEAEVTRAQAAEGANSAELVALKAIAVTATSETDAAKINQIIADSVTNHTIAAFNSITVAETITIPANAVVSIIECTYTGNDYAFNFDGGDKARVYIHNLSCPNGGGFNFSAGVHMDGGSITVDRAKCSLPVINYMPVADNVSWAQYLKLDGDYWYSTAAPVIRANINSSVANTQWMNGVYIRNISFATDSPYAAIDVINRDYTAVLFGFDQWYLECVSFEKCYQALHLYSVTGWKSKNIRAAETQNYVLRIAGYCPDCDFEFSGFIKKKSGLPFIDSNVDSHTCFVTAPIYKDGSDVLYKDEPVVTKMKCGKHVVIPIETNLTKFETESGSYTVPKDFNTPQPAYFQISDNFTLDLGSDFYGINKIPRVYLYGYSANVTNCKVIVNDKPNTVVRPGLYAITASNSLINVSGQNG